MPSVNVRKNHTYILVYPASEKQPIEIRGVDLEVKIERINETMMVTVTDVRELKPGEGGGYYLPRTIIACFTNPISLEVFDV